MASYTAIKDYLEYKGRIGSANNSPELILGPSNIARRDRQIMSCYLNSLEFLSKFLKALLLTNTNHIYS